MLSPLSLGRNDDGKSNVLRFFDGQLDDSFFCAFEDGQYRLFNRFYSEFVPAVSNIKGKRVDADKRYRQNPMSLFGKGNYTELRLGWFNAPVFKKGVKVLSLKPEGDGQFTTIFYPAKIVSGPKECPRKYQPMNIPSCIIRKDLKRHEYVVKFDDGTKSTVYEEFIVPTKEFWGNEKEIYENDSSSSSSSSSSDSSSSSSSSDSSSDDKSKKKQYKKNHKHSKSSKHNKHHKHHKHSHKSPSVVIVPIFIPMNGLYML